jgi:hypothetical protein
MGPKMDLGKLDGNWPYIDFMQCLMK